MNDFIISAVQEKISWLETYAVFAERARRGDLTVFDRVMARDHGGPPDPGDEMPPADR